MPERRLSATHQGQTLFQLIHTEGTPVRIVSCVGDIAWDMRRWTEQGLVERVTGTRRYTPPTDFELLPRLRAHLASQGDFNFNYTDAS